jgi:hypothetical protein
MAINMLSTRLHKPKGIFTMLDSKAFISVQKSKPEITPKYHHMQLNMKRRTLKFSARQGSRINGSTKKRGLHSTIPATCNLVEVALEKLAQTSWGHELCSLQCQTT